MNRDVLLGVQSSVTRLQLSNLLGLGVSARIRRTHPLLTLLTNIPSKRTAPGKVIVPKGGEGLSFTCGLYLPHGSVCSASGGLRVGAI